MLIIVYKCMGRVNTDRGSFNIRMGSVYKGYEH